MKKIAIVTDSTANITAAELNKYSNIRVIPLFFMFGEDSYVDGTLTQEEFFKLVDELYDSRKVLPTTSQPTIGSTQETFQKLLNDEGYDHIIYLTISSKLSGTFQNGVLASKDFSDKVTCFDSLTTTAALKALTIKACELVNKGKDVEQIITNLNVLRNSLITYLVVDDINHLKRTGRISAAQSVVGSLVKLKPILEIENGQIFPIDKVRNLGKAHKSIIDKVMETEITKFDYICVAHANDLESALKIKQYIVKKHPEVDIEIAEISQVVSTHTGRGTVGIIAIKDYYLEV